MTKWAKGILLIFLIVGFTLAGAVSYTPVAAATNDDSVYETFWSILNREAELVAKLNVTNNTSVANELVKNSQLGAQNAVNISALVWNALEELQKSGVKMYYSPEELRKMAQNISKNGLPKETVQSLKSQGWTDEEINELEEYIAKNADNITSGFNMSTFLQNFSLAFVRVGFKYTYYESWGLYKAFWEGKEKTVKRPTNYTTLINPLLSQDWLNLYKAYTAGDVDKELSSASALSSKMMGLFKSRTGVKDVLKLITRNNDKLLLTSKYKVSRVTHLTDGGLLIYASHEGISKQALSVEYLDKYYWWNALRAYRTLREIQVILGAMKKGNTDPRLRAMLNQKMAQLKDELIVDCVETSTPIRILPNPGPVPIPKPPVSAETRSASLPSAQSTKVSTNKATQLEIFALSPNTNYGYIDNLQVTLEKSVLANGQLEYHIHVSFAVEKNALSNVTVKLSDSRGSDSVHYSVLQVGSQSWDSKSFTTSERILNPGDSVTITGTVTITYTAMDTPTPTSTNSGSEIAGGPKKGEISTSYSFTVTYDDLMQDSRVHIQVIPEPSSITTDQSVTFQLVITNNNPVPIYGHWEADIYVPSQKDGNPHPLPPISGNVEVYPGKTETVTVATITYVRAGDYNYSVTFSFGSSNNKKVQGIIHVKGDSGPAGSLEIKNVTPSPPSPKSGDVVNFTVKVRNAYLTKKDVEVKLFIDDKFADETGGSIPATSDMTFTLHWLAESGQHSYEVKLYSVDERGVKTLVGSRQGIIIVGNSTRQFAVELEAFPRELEGGGTVYFTVKAWNFASDALNVHFKVTNGEGAVVKEFNKFIPKGVSNYSVDAFSLEVYGVGNYTYILTADISGEVEKSTTTVRVEPASNVIANMTCMDSIISYDGSTTCEVTLLNTGNDSVSVSVTSVDFGTIQNAWAESYQRGIEVKPVKITLPPHDDKEIDVKIDLRKLAQDFWGNDHFAFKFAEHTSYEIVVHFDNGIKAGDVLTILNKSFEPSKVGIVCSIIGSIGAGIATGADPAAAVAGAGLGYAFGAGLEKLYWELYLITHDANWNIPPDNNGNSVNGG